MKEHLARGLLIAALLENLSSIIIQPSSIDLTVLIFEIYPKDFVVFLLLPQPTEPSFKGPGAGWILDKGVPIGVGDFLLFFPLPQNNRESLVVKVIVRLQPYRRPKIIFGEQVSS